MSRKNQSKSFSEFAIRISTYPELDGYCRAFAAGYLSSLILLGAPGLGKRYFLRQAVDGSTLWVDGNATAFGVYGESYAYCNQPIVFEKPDALLRDPNGIRLLKALCQMKNPKQLYWSRDFRALDLGGIPYKFSTTSRVAIVANQWEWLNVDGAALEDCGHVVVFAPTSLDVHRQAASWFWDQEIFDFVAKHLHLIREHSLRTYVLAWELKRAGLDWRAMVLSRCLMGPALLVAKLKADPQYACEEDRVRAFIEAGAGCRATYFNHAKRLAAPGPAPAITLANTQPPDVAHPPTDFLDILRKRFGQLGNG